MATKWKSRWKQIGWLFLLSAGIGSLFVVLYYSDTYTYKNYYKTPTFQHELDDFLTKVVQFEFKDQTLEEEIEAIKVTEEDLNEYRYEYGAEFGDIQSIHQHYQDELEWNELDEGSEMAQVLREQRDKDIVAVREIFDDEALTARIQAEKEQQLKDQFVYLERERQIFHRLESTFHYYFISHETGDVYTNMDHVVKSRWEESFNEDSMEMYQSYTDMNGLMESNYPFYNSEGWFLSEATATTNEETNMSYEGAIGIPSDRTSAITSAADDYRKRQLSLVGFALLGVGLVTTAGRSFRRIRNELAESTKGLKLERVPTDLLLGIAIILSILLLIFGDQFANNLLYLSEYSTASTLFSLAMFLLCIGLLFIVVYRCLTMKKTESLKELAKRSIMYRFTTMIKEAFEHRSVGIQLSLLLGTVFLFGVGFPLFFIEAIFLLFYFIALLLVGLPLFILLLKRVGYFNNLIKESKKIVAGEAAEPLPIKGGAVLSDLAQTLNQLKEGLQHSQQKQLKSERLKTELITNVSHDLRTPLTSVITYTELLKNDNLSHEERASYIDIIDRKSQRLKLLIEDLFEASKMASGNVELKTETVDLNQLLKQALAESNQAIEASSLHFRVKEESEPLYAKVDGQKLWRVFDNLLTNILRYALPETRVYIHARKEENRIKISFKNVTNYELGDNVDELFERFKRGDSSRHTEGSGLGLAIAKSIAQLHGGDVQLEVDGDLFKATVLLPAL
ncbi:sensor histidine kinase [Shouchella hunanensis]|uniref:histidine kinase n=1 Tax=Shouchella hunanensis TaxID=766894 RepID=A0ABY7WAS5_9BACI|nr:HAMP domain-containing sensor histidine kinase [Shouchella hunanensis]WDF04960.1 HAMP domain-containing sensor histidine kinase [Shouchella hunanensis]